MKFLLFTLSIIFSLQIVIFAGPPKLNSSIHSLVLADLTDDPTGEQTPTITIISPESDPYISSSCDETVTARITSVNNANQIRVYLDGNPLTTFTYDAASEIMTVHVLFSKNSVLKISARNKGGHASEQITLKCQKQ
jgi:hypothetical protein